MPHCFFRQVSILSTPYLEREVYYWLYGPDLVVTNYGPSLKPGSKGLLGTLSSSFSHSFSGSSLPSSSGVGIADEKTDSFLTDHHNHIE